MLDDDYYLQNFLTLIDFVADVYGELLSVDERDWYQRFHDVSEPAQRLYVRLITRKPSVFRRSKLQYPEIDSLNTAASELADSALACCDAPSDFAVLLATFTKPEIVKLLGLTKVAGISRAELVQSLLDAPAEESVQALQHADQWISITGYECFSVFQLCFFGNCYQDLSEFVLRDLGVFTYENYLIDKRSRVFQSREQIDAHLQYFTVAALSEQHDSSNAEELIALVEQLPDVSIKSSTGSTARTHTDPHLQRRVERFRNGIARQLERLEENEKALSLYQQSLRPPSRERQIRLLMKLSRVQEAAVLHKVVQDNPIDEEELQFSYTIQPKLNKLMNRKSPALARFRPNTTKLTLSRSNGRVEQIAQAFYQQYGECHYVENSLVNGVLGLLIWDIIFAPLDGVFFNPFQAAPADFYLPEFTESRQQLLSERLKCLDDPLAFSATVWEHYESKQGLMNPLVNWGRLTEPLLSTALMRVPVAHWRALFGRLLKDLRNHTSGLPDLVLFPHDGGYEMIEIKGPGDAVQKNQKRWMAYFAENRVPYRVVHIRWASES